MSKLLFVLCAATAVSCGGGGGDDDDDTMADAPAASTLMEVNPCPATTDATVLTMAGNNYMPKDTTITQGQVVKFDMNANHDVAPSVAPTDSTLRVPLGGTKCFRFTAAGTFNFKCTPHGFVGSIIVN
jgi:plastocyanin